MENPDILFHQLGLTLTTMSNSLYPTPKKPSQWGQTQLIALRRHSRASKWTIKDIQLVQVLLSQMVIAQGWLWPQWAVRNYVRTFPRPLGNTEVLPRWTELFDFGVGMCCLCNAVAFCCLLLDCNPGPLETTVRAVFIFDVLMEVGLSLQKQTL